MNPFLHLFKKNRPFWWIFFIWIGAGGLGLLRVFTPPSLRELSLNSDALAALPPLLTLTIGLFYAKSLFHPPKEKAQWMAALLGLSILFPIAAHIFFDKNTLVYLTIGGILPVVTFGFVFPGALPFLFALGLWAWCPYPLSKRWPTWVFFILTAVLWEVTLLTGIFFGYGA